MIPSRFKQNLLGRRYLCVSRWKLGGSTREIEGISYDRGTIVHTTSEEVTLDTSRLELAKPPASPLRRLGAISFLRHLGVEKARGPYLDVWP